MSPSWTAARLRRPLVAVGLNPLTIAAAFGLPIRVYGSAVADRSTPVEVRTTTLHGHSVTYAEAGSGPILLLIHGMGGTFENWEAVCPSVSRVGQAKAMTPIIPVPLSGAADRG